MWGVGISRGGLQEGSPGWAAFEARLLAIPFSTWKSEISHMYPPGSGSRVEGLYLGPVWGAGTAQPLSFWFDDGVPGKPLPRGQLHI